MFNISQNCKKAHSSEVNYVFGNIYYKFLRLKVKSNKP